MQTAQCVHVHFGSFMSQFPFPFAEHVHKQGVFKSLAT